MLYSSVDNKHIKDLKKLNTKKYRDKTSSFLIEGEHLVLEAYKTGHLKELILDNDRVMPLNVETSYVTNNVFNYISTLETPPDIMGVCSKLEKKEIGNKILILDNIQDPGNLGTILRTIDSVGLNQVIVSKETADAYNPKVVRSTMGAIFRVNIIESDNLLDTLKNIKKHKYKIMATSLETQNSIYDIDYNKKVLVIGNEANGVSQEILDYADEKIKIPMLGKTESLNASVATAVILYEYVRNKIK